MYAVCDGDDEQMTWTMLEPTPPFAADIFETSYDSKLSSMKGM